MIMGINYSLEYELYILYHWFLVGDGSKLNINSAMENSKQSLIPSGKKISYDDIDKFFIFFCSLSPCSWFIYHFMICVLKVLLR